MILIIVGIWYAIGLISILVGLLLEMIYPELKEFNKTTTIPLVQIVLLIFIASLFGPITTYTLIRDFTKARKKIK